MSTVIHNGYRLPAGLDLAGLCAWVQALRPAFRALAIAQLQQELLARAVGLYDIDTARAHGLVVDASATPQGRCLQRAHDSLVDEVFQARQDNRACVLDPATTLAVIPDDQALFALLYAEQPALAAHFSALPGVERYAYSNATDDLPEGVTWEQWQARGKHWDRLLGPTGCPDDVCVSLTLVPPILLRTLPIPDDAQPAIASGAKGLSIARRAYRVALATPASVLPPADQALWEATSRLSIWVNHDARLRQGAVPQFNQAVADIASWLDPAPTVGRVRTGPPFPAPRAAGP